MGWRTVVLGTVSTLATIGVAADEQPSPVRIDGQGTVHITEIEVPPSSYMSREARESLIAIAREPPDPIWEDVNAPIEKLREQDELESRDLLQRARTRYAVNIEEQRIGGVRVRVVTPKAGVAARNKEKVLVELHGGGFFTGANAEALLESIPVAAVGGFKVIAVDYRQGPEHRFPAATEDVANVYKALLKQYDPTRIGLFGCSAGGTLSAMAVASFQKAGLPKPGAIGLFSSGAYAGFNDPPGVRGAWGGDSRYTAPGLNGESLLPLDPRDLKFPAVADAYLKGVDREDPFASPALHPAVLEKFPPTLLITSTRGFDMSVAVQTHREMVKAGVDADLHVWDGVGHCFFVDVDLPESREAFSVMTRFFDQRLGRGFSTVPAAAAEQPTAVQIDGRGVARIRELEVPLSSYMSPEARQSFIESAGAPTNPAWSDVNAPIELLRKLSEGPAGKGVEVARTRYPVNIEERVIGGVRARVVTPKEGVATRNEKRVLIELHGGGFFTGAYGQAMLDSIPLAAVGGYRVISVDYRQGPENEFPAATEDVAAVYKELLQQYDPSRIGLYGCSTGGSLAAMAVAWFQKEKLPRPGAIGIFSGGAFAGFEGLPNNAGSWGGDSRYTAPGLVGEPLWAIDPQAVRLPAVTEAYLKGADLRSPLASPALHPNVLAQFPATLLITGTRSFGMSAAIQTHKELVKAGVAADLHMWDGHGHCFYYDFDLPESHEAFAVMTKFFDQRLGR